MHHNGGSGRDAKQGLTWCLNVGYDCTWWTQWWRERVWSSVWLECRVRCTWGEHYVADIKASVDAPAATDNTSDAQASGHAGLPHQQTGVCLSFVHLFISPPPPFFPGIERLQIEQVIQRVWALMCAVPVYLYRWSLARHYPTHVIFVL